jgi:hypothetical protein
LLGFLFDPENRGDIFLRNIGLYSRDFTACIPKYKLLTAIVFYVSLPNFASQWRHGVFSARCLFIIGKKLVLEGFRYHPPLRI